MAERSTPGAPNRYSLAAMTPRQQQMLAQAKAYHHITTPGMPSGWAFNGRGDLVDISRPDDAANPNQAPGVTLAPPNSAPGSSFGGQLLHALPYIAGAEGMGLAGVYGPLAAGGGAGAAPAATGVLPATATVPTSTGTVAGLAPSGAVPAAMAPRSVGSVLSGVGSWLGTPGGGAALGAAGTLIGAGIESRGISHAADVQAQTAREALAYAKQRDQYLQNLEAQRYGQFNARMQPYMNLGNSAGARMAQILGLDPGQFAPAQTWPGVTGSETGAVESGIHQRGPGTPGGPAEGTAVPAPGMAGSPPSTAQMVMMRAPDGSTNQVPQSMASHYQQLGATVIG